MNKVVKELIRLKKKEEIQQREFYELRSLLGYDWAMFYILLGGRQRGKSYSIADFFTTQFVHHDTPFYWLRLKPKQCEKLLKNNAEQLIDPDLKRKFKLDLTVTSPHVYQVMKRTKKDKNGRTKIVKKKLMATVLPISTFYDDKGIGYFDKDYDGWYNIVIDEFQREKGEKNTFDIMYSLVNQLETLVRNTKAKIRVFFIGNTLEEASDVLCSFNFIPEEFGRYTLVKNKKILVKYLAELKNAKTDQEKRVIFDKYKGIDFGKRAVIDYIESSEGYKKMRAGSIADILMPEASTFTNKVETDYSLVKRGRLTTPQYVIKFGKTKDCWFTVWDTNTIAKYNGEQKPVISMRPYLDEIFNVKARDQIVQQFDYRGFTYRDLITFKQFQKFVELVKPRK